jgi:hypothetical protein
MKTAPCSLLEEDRRFNDAYYLSNQPFNILMIEAVLTSETSVYFNETKRRYIPECSNLKKKKRAYNIVLGLPFLFMLINYVLNRTGRDISFP